MKLHVFAVGRKMPAWVNAGFDEYARRMPRTLRVELMEIKPAARTGGEQSAQWLRIEAQRIRAAVPAGCVQVVLDERGKLPTTDEFARRLESWQRDARPVAFIIGGADGIAWEFQRGADWLLALSRLTLPHGLTRVLLAEQLYRAASLLAGHPYHRE
jgi:23S rRNA (pseudouridine1915-N3)-methyltransferase